jgi:iron(III) transport system permease protein
VSLSELADPALSTATVAVTAAVLAVLVVLPIAVASIRRPHPLSQMSAVSVVAGFAIPGLVIALSLATLTLNTPVFNRFYQTMALLIVAYIIHFGSQALAGTETAVRGVPAGLRESSKLLEPRRGRRALRIDMPLMRPGLAAAGGLVMLSTLKELPITLLLSPIGFSTLATDIWASYEEGFYAATGLASLVLVAMSAVPTWILVLRPSEAVSS